ncbi:MAG: dTDP-4-dehydrorhamnose 3,5-epimerase, partial [Bacilli bacterium]|uniref:dTDP-4-dehydrorhamnose 3,5-epimerase n=1 Tax=Anaerorhabdus sp. TaxID=1872524 RepID=UPI002FC8A002
RYFMKVIDLTLNGLKLLKLDRFEDNRGWFEEVYNYDKYKEAGIDNCFVQDNRSFSKVKGVLRGMHFQKNPYSQAKLVRCTKGMVLDIVVDLRKDSSTYLKWEAVELSEDRVEQLYIPRGFAHGFYCVSDDVIFEYKVDNVYSKENERSVNYLDPQFNIDWEHILKGVKPILSDKDANAPMLEEVDCDF